MPGCPQRPAHRPCPAPAGRPGRRRHSRTASSLANLTMASTSVAGMALQWASYADAAVAGQHTRSRHSRGLFFSARMMACSRPPPPTTRIFISVLLDSTTARDEKSPQASCFLRLMMEQPDAAERHRNAVLVAGVDHLCVADGAARLRNSGHAAAARALDIIAEREEGITAQRSHRSRHPARRAFPRRSAGPAAR